MNVTIKQIRAFLAIVEVNSFAEACELLHISQPALSITIKNLEECVGGSLLSRTTRTLALTPEGKLFVPVAKRLLVDFDTAFIDLNELFSMKRGNLTFAAMPSYASTHLPEHIFSFNKEYPTIKVKVHDIVAENAVEMVKSGQVEFAISFDPDTSKDLHFEALFSDEFVCAFPKKHPLSKNTEVNWQHLVDYPFIALQRPSSVRKLIDEMLAEQDIFLNVDFETNQLATVVQMIASGLGISAIPSLYKQQLHSLNLDYREISKPTINRRVGIITRRRYPLSQPAQAFIDTLLKVYQ